MPTEPSSLVSTIASRTVDFVSAAELSEKLQRAGAEKRYLRIKLGMDPSAPDIHLGHVVVLNKLREWQEAGHTIVFIIGDFTAMIGDPSGRSQTRKPLTRDEVQRNAVTYQEQVYRVLDRDRVEIRYNSEWCAPMTFEDVLRLSSRVTVAQMLARDDFAKRYGENQPISLVEFMYPLIQAYDSVQVQADVEVGGTDQLFNLLLGRELQKAFGQPSQVVMTLPLLEGLDGVQKMSKSLDNYVGVTDAPNDMFGKIMSVSDELMWKYLDLVQCMEAAEVAARRDRHPREVKDELARTIVDRFHGAGTGEACSREFARVFKDKELPADMPEIVVAAEDLHQGEVGILTLINKAGLASSNSEARRLVQQGAVRFNEEKITDPQTYLRLPPEGILRCGKRGFARIRT